MNKLRMMIDPTPEEAAILNKRMKEVFDRYVKDRGCSTCGNCRHVREYPDFVTGEENECTVGLECDTVLFRVKNCPKYKEMEWKDAY